MCRARVQDLMRLPGSYGKFLEGRVQSTWSSIAPLALFDKCGNSVGVSSHFDRMCHVIQAELRCVSRHLQVCVNALVFSSIISSFCAGASPKVRRKLSRQQRRAIVSDRRIIVKRIAAARRLFSWMSNVACKCFEMASHPHGGWESCSSTRFRLANAGRLLGRRPAMISNSYHRSCRGRADVIHRRGGSVYGSPI